MGIWHHSKNRSRGAKEMSSSTTTPQQERSREVAGMEHKQAGAQNECKDATTGRWQEEAETKEATPGAQQELIRVIAKTQQIRLGGRCIQQGERSMKPARLHNRNAAKTTRGRRRNPAGLQQKTIRNSVEL